MTIQRIDKGPRMSQAAIVGNLVFTAGRWPRQDRRQDVGTQTREILDGIDALLARAGSDKSKIASVHDLARATWPTSTR